MTQAAKEPLIKSFDRSTGSRHRMNGNLLIPFVVSLSNHERNRITQRFPKSQAFTSGRIKEEAIRLKMPKARNRMSHTYDARKALEIYPSFPQFHQALQN